MKNLAAETVKMLVNCMLDKTVLKFLIKELLK
jgi:hypothetical protein